jgi:hypothetical protein
MLDEDLQHRLTRYAEVLFVEVPPLATVRGRSRRQKLHAVAGTVTALVIAAGLFIALGTSLFRASPPGSGITRITPPGSGGAGLSLPGGIPIPLGVESTLEAAAGEVDFPLYRPRDLLASDQTIDHVWVSSAVPQQVALKYASGILVLIEKAQFTDPIAKYQAIAKQFPPSYVISIGNAPALVLPGNIPGRAPTIDMVISGIHVQIQGGTGSFSVDDMLRVAGTIDQG